MKYLMLLLMIPLLPSCGSFGYGSASVEASNGIVPAGQSSPIIVPGVFGAAQTQSVSGPSANAAERASKAKSFWGN